MQKTFKALLASSLAISLSFSVATFAPTAASAQSYANYCHDRAQRLSGYRGRPGNAVEGAIGGAVGGALLSGILGGDRRDRERAAAVGALLGGISNANRPNSRAARIYRLEYDDCMRRR